MSRIGEIDEQFTRQCSTKTLQAEEKGFFNEFFYSVVDSFKSESEYKIWVKEQFAKQASDFDKLHFLYLDDTVSWTILGSLEHVKPVYRKKDSLFSWQKREQVMKLLKSYDEKKAEIDLTKVLVLASQAVMRAPMKDVDREVDNGLTLALALLTRSEVFLRLNDGEHGLSDLQLSAKCGLPVKDNAEYYAKLAKFYTLLKETNRAAISVKLCHQISGYNDLKKEKLEEELKQLAEKVSTANLKSKIITKKPLPKVASNSTAESSDGGKYISSKCTLKSDEVAGKYFVAGSEINAGETILVEKAKCACLYPKNFGTHCNNCFHRLVAPIGCPDCASIAFCSVECRDASSYHKYECKYLDLLIGSGMSILCHIALKIIIQCKDPQEALINGKKFLDGLCTHREMRDPEDSFKRCLMTTFLLRCLQKAEFFGRRTTESAEPTKSELEIGALIFSLLQAIQFNAHEIYETVSTQEHKFQKSKVHYIGVGIYEVAALFNHECYPSQTRHFNGTHLIFNTIRPHWEGEVIAENYGPIFTRQNLNQRQRNLSSRYWFKCQCKACKEDWPIQEKLNNKSRLKCPTPDCAGFFPYPSNRGKSVKCNKCKNMVSLNLQIALLDEAEELYRQGALMMDSENVNEAINFFVKGIDLFHKVALPPHKDTHIAQESLRACLADAGNTFVI